MARKDYSIVRQQIESLYKQAEGMEKEAVHVLVNALMTPNVKASLAMLSKSELQAVAKKLSAQVAGDIAEVQAERTAKKSAPKAAVVMPQQ